MTNEAKIFDCPYCDHQLELRNPFQFFTELPGVNNYTTQYDCTSCQKEITLVVYKDGIVETLAVTKKEYDDDEIAYYYSLRNEDEMSYEPNDEDLEFIESTDNDNHQNHLPRDQTSMQSISYASLSEEYKGGHIPYSIILDTHEWKLKRDEVKLRDNYKCQSCLKRATEYSRDNCFEEENKLSDWSGNYWVVSINELPNYPNYPYEVQKGREADGSTVKVAVIASDKSYNLHVHHKFYIYNVLPWEYENGDLITLCNWCHWDLHQKESVKVYVRTNGKLLPLTYTACDRCNAAGVFPEYSHVQNGICFKCNGERYFISEQ